MTEPPSKRARATRDLQRKRKRETEETQRTEPLTLSERARARRDRLSKRIRENEGEEPRKKRAHLDDEIIECEYCGWLLWWNDECTNCDCECPECGKHPYYCDCCCCGECYLVLIS